MDSATVFSDDPAAQAASFEAQGFRFAYPSLEQALRLELGRLHAEEAAR